MRAACSHMLRHRPDGFVEHVAAIRRFVGGLVGIVAEGDFLRRAETGTARIRSCWRLRLSEDEAAN
jgi:hypothetical protein